MKILKRSGVEVAFDVNKIIAAVTKANQTVDLKNTLTAEQIQSIGKYVEGVCSALDRALSVEEIQDIVETQIMKEGAFEVAKKYITRGAKWRLQFSCTSGVVGLLLTPNNQLVANRGVVSQISPDSELAENGLVARNFKRRKSLV